MERKIACIGLGRHMRKTLWPGVEPGSGRLCAVCDKDEKRLKEFCDFAPLGSEHCYTDMEEMLDKERPQAVICAVNPDIHFRAAKACMERGISPFVEKAPCSSAKQARELEDLEKSSGCFCMVGFNRRYTTSYCMAKTLVRQNIPVPMFYTAKYHSSRYESESRFLLNHVIHHLDLARFLLGEIKTISAKELVLDEQRMGLQICFQTEAGTLGMLETSSFLSEAFPMERVEISGIGCNLVIDNIKSLEYNSAQSARTERNPVLDKNDGTLSWNCNHGHSSMYSHYGYERELKEYFWALENGKKPGSCMENAARTMELYEQLLGKITRSQVNAQGEK